MKLNLVICITIALGPSGACKTKTVLPTCANVGAMLDQRLTTAFGLLASPEPALALRSLQHAVAYLTERCERDHWSSAAIACVSSARNDAMLGDCKKMLSRDQRTGIAVEARALHNEIWAHSCLEQKQAKAAASKQGSVAP